MYLGAEDFFKDKRAPFIYGYDCTDLHRAYQWM
jgi:hypothetical protein